MRGAFSSSFLIDKISKVDKTQRGRLLKHFENALGAISYHLERVVPRGGVICAYHPKGILGSILPAIAKEKNCKVLTVHGTKQAVVSLMKAGVLSTGNPAEADVFLTEPDGLSADGALFKPHEASDLPHKEIIAVGSALQFTKERPASHDIAPVYKIVTELGIHSAEHLEKEVTFAFSWLASSPALKPSPAPLQPPLRPASIPFPILPERLPIP
jgi:hypothetical protein